MGFLHSISYFHCLAHPCDQNKGGCEAMCKKQGDQAVCSCIGPGKVLAKDNKHCVKG